MVLTQQKLKISGLNTANNELSSVSEGSLAVAQNIDILSADIAQPRRGFELATATGYSDAAYRTDKIFHYQTYLFSHYGTYGSANTLRYYNSGWNAVGTYSAPTGRRMRTVEANQNLYFTTSTGVKKIDAYNSTPATSGVPKAMNMTVSLTGTGGFLADDPTNDKVVAYRCVWLKEDANDNLIIGAPSGRVVATNTAASGIDYNVAVRVYIPDAITTSYYCQLYRTTVHTSTPASPSEPSDELYLCYEVFPTSTNITNGYLDITDIVTDDLLGAALYTNATQEGLAYQNEQPPLARDIATFNDSTFYAYTTSKHRYYLTLLSASAMANDDTIAIGGVTYTAKASETVASGQFKRFTAGTASQNIADTAKSLVNVINNYSSSTVYAYYLSSGDDLPGKILLEEREIGGAAFAITASVGTYWSPTGIPTSGTTETSSNDEYKNGLSWSKPKQPEHVPLVNTARVGSEDGEILRIVPLKDALVIFKEDGIYRLTGHYPNFDIELLDSSAVLIGAETPSILNNEIYCLTDLGICRVSDSVEIISLKINTELIQNISTNTTLIESVGFGQGYETDKKYYLFLPEDSGDTYPTFAYVYNIFTNSFVKHYMNATCSTVYGKLLYYGNAASEFVMKERKNYSYLDYVDYNFATSISVISSTTITLASGVDNITVGDILWQSNNLFATITAKDTILSTVTIDQDPGLTVAACTILSAIDTKIKWTVFADPTPGITKQHYSTSLFFQEGFNGTGYIGFSTDLEPSEELITVDGNDNGSWGLFLWGDEPWGGVNSPRSWSQWVPRTKQRCSQMNISFSHRWGYSQWKLTGGILNGSEGSDKIRRT